jgi:hypothetical protein
MSAERRLRETLGGVVRVGATHWSPRIGPLLAVLNDTTDVRLIIDPGPDCAMLVRACSGMWHYDVTRGGTVERDAPAKNERLFADLGDALCYAVGEMRPSRPQKRTEPRRTRTRFDVFNYQQRKERERT